MSASVVPARAGMSPIRVIRKVMHIRGPRASGDEPGRSIAQGLLNVWSPRERG